MIWAVLLLVGRVAAFSKYHGRCAINIGGLEVAQQQAQRVMHARDVGIRYRPIPNAEIQLSERHLINHRFIGSGASAEVFLVEDLGSRRMFIAKRYADEQDYRIDNYLTKQMGDEIYWTRDRRQGGLLSLQEFISTKNWKGVVLSHREFKLTLYKIVYELDRMHRIGWMHRDIKPLNVVVEEANTTYSRQVRLIDWNGATQYYLGVRHDELFGTKCYKSPQMLIGLKYYTPAVDIWSLGVAAYYRFFGRKPLRKNCSAATIEAVVELVGFQPFVTMYFKYRPEADLDIIDRLLTVAGRKGTLEHHFSSQKGDDPETIALRKLLRRMLEVDPDIRATASQLLQDPYFQQLTNITTPGKHNADDSSEP